MTLCAETYCTPRSGKNKIIGCAILIGAFIIAIGLAIGLAVGLQSHDNETPAKSKPRWSSAFGKYRAAAVAADSALCSKIGTDIMILKGGSAVDAAIATLLCNGLVNTHSMGIGGGFFMTIYNSTSKTSDVLIARERAPNAATADMFSPGKGVSSQDGAKAIGVPGEIAGYWEAHKKYGRLPWQDLFTPSIKLAREGIPIERALVVAIDMFKDKYDKFPGLKKLFYEEKNKKTKRKGDTFTRPLVANTLETLAKGNGRTFYEGSLAQDIVDDIDDAADNCVKRIEPSPPPEPWIIDSKTVASVFCTVTLGGIITTEDLKQYTADWRRPVTLDFNEMKIYSVPPPGSGAVLEYILNILDGYNLKEDDISTDERAILTYHRIAEAMKFAYAKRTSLADADFVDVSELVRNMTSKQFGASIRSEIDDDRTHETAFYGPTFVQQETPGTAHISVLDVDGNAVGVTSTINTRFGSKVIGSRTGIIFNNQMDDFSTPDLINKYGVKPSPANFITPGKRPMSSMSPTIIVDEKGSVKMIVGASGGPLITTASALTCLHALRFGKNINEAIDEGRIHHQLIPKELFVEESVSQVLIDGLKKKGHAIKILKLPGRFTARVQAILRKESEIQACSDFRKGGKPFGY